MTVGERIKARLEALAMSQSELARRAHLTQGTIGGLIIGKSRSSAYLHQIARELGTTPAYLTGEIDDPDSDGPMPSPLDGETREMVDHFALLSPADRRALLQVARSLSSGPKAAGTVHDKGIEFRGEAGAAKPGKRAR